MRSLMPADSVTFLGSDGLINQAFIDGAGDAAQGAFVTFAGVPPAELKGPGADYFTRISEILGHSPDSYATYGYESAVVVIQAIDQVQDKDRQKILDAMLATEELHRPARQHVELHGNRRHKLRHDVRQRDQAQRRGQA